MTDLSGKQVLVTGAGGFIGSHLCEELVAQGANVRALVEYNSLNHWGNLEQLPDDVVSAMEVVSGDIRDPFATREAVRGQDVVLHLAALIGIPYSYVAPQSYVATNVQGTVNVLEGIRAEGGNVRLVHTSTSETYGTATYTPIDEAHPLQGQSPYSASKIAADKMVESYHRSFELPVTTLRPFNTFGPRQSLRAVIPTIGAQALTGSEVRLGSLDPKRDLTYVGDTARAFVACLSDDAIGKTLNAGRGEAVTIGELAKTIIELAGSDAEVVSEEERVRPEASEVGELIANADALRELTGWQPEVSLQDGLERTLEWLRGNLDGLKPELYNV